MKRKWILVFSLLGVLSRADIMVQDDLGRAVTLPGPAQRVISLAPHLTEVVYAIGGGQQIVATVAWSDFPEEAKSLPVIGSNNKINYESLLTYKPDLILLWHSGNGQAIAQKLQALGLNVYVNEPRKLESISKTLDNIGRLLGREKTAKQVAGQFNETLEELRQQYGGAERVGVYYQIWRSPLITFGGNHLVSNVLKLCGGKNVFGSLQPLVPRLSTESVLAADPQVIIVGQYSAVEESFDDWRRWPHLQAVKYNHLYSVDPYQLNRHTPRILQGATELCEKLALVRGG